jgi:hypothetical protein
MRVADAELPIGERHNDLLLAGSAVAANCPSLIRQTVFQNTCE